MSVPLRHGGAKSIYFSAVSIQEPCEAKVGVSRHFFSLRFRFLSSKEISPRNVNTWNRASRTAPRGGAGGPDTLPGTSRAWRGRGGADTGSASACWGRTNQPRSRLLPRGVLSSVAARPLPVSHGEQKREGARYSPARLSVPCSSGRAGSCPSILPSTAGSGTPVMLQALTNDLWIKGDTLGTSPPLFQATVT